MIKNFKNILYKISYCMLYFIFFSCLHLLTVVYRTVDQDGREFSERFPGYFFLFSTLHRPKVTKIDFPCGKINGRKNVNKL